MAQADAVETLIAPVSAVNSVHESLLLPDGAGYVALS